MIDNVRQPQEGRSLSRSRRERPTWRSALPCVWRMRRSALRAGDMSELRNPTIAKVMYSRKTVETWGRGIKLILDECANANLPEPQILAGGGYTRTVFMRPSAGSEGGMKGGALGDCRRIDYSGGNSCGDGNGSHGSVGSICT